MLQFSNEIDIYKELADTRFTIDFILNTLYEFNLEFKDIAADRPITKVTAHDLSEGKGFASKVFKTTVYFENTSYDFIVKIPTSECIQDLMDSILDSNDQREIGYDEEKLHADILTQHNMECRYYEYFSQPSNPLPQPKIYFVQEMSNSHQGIIFMEDLSKNTKTINIFTPLTNGQIKNMLQHIMNFHLFIFQQTEMPWQSKFPKSALEEFEVSITPKMLNQLIEFRPGLFEALVDKVLKLFLNLNFTEFALRSCSKELSLPTTICHGDLWTPNILWAELENDHNLDGVAAIIDFQNVFEGNPMFDIALLLTMCTDASIRRNWENSIFSSYIENLKNTLKPEVCEKISVNNLKKAYGYAMVYSAVKIATCVAFFRTVESTQPEKMELLVQRAKLALEDAVNFLDNDGKWLCT